jgi:hypothetical protein
MPYRPWLLRNASEWNQEDMALLLTSGDKLAGIHAVSLELIRNLTEPDPRKIETLSELHSRLTATHSVVCAPVGDNMWQRVRTGGLRVRRTITEWMAGQIYGRHLRFRKLISAPGGRIM